MAQGNHKLGKPKKVAAGKQRKVVKIAKMTKKGNAKGVERNKGILAATKIINKKNERLIAAKALNAGTNFSLTDIATKGKDSDLGHDSMSQNSNGAFPSQANTNRQDKRQRETRSKISRPSLLRGSKCDSTNSNSVY